MLTYFVVGPDVRLHDLARSLPAACCILYRNLYSCGMARVALFESSISVTDAASRGVAALVREAELGTDILVERRHRPVAAVISVGRLEALREAQRDLRDIGLVLARAATDSGSRTSLDDVLARFGLGRAELEAELDEDLAAGRP